MRVSESMRMNSCDQAAFTLAGQSADGICYETSVKVTGRWLKTAVPENQYDEIVEPGIFIQSIKERCIAADLFAFSQKPPHTQPRFDYPMEWDNVAAIPVSTYDDWWHKQVEKKVRKHVRRAAKAGVSVRVIAFDDELVAGISRIYNESPIRGGRRFRHFGDDFETCKRKHATHLDRSEFVGAFLDGELIGFIKMVYSGVTARTIQNISMIKHGTLAPGNALLAKAVEICAQKSIAYLIYGKMRYANKGSDAFEAYKRANGFEMFNVPRFFVPLTRKGRIAIKLGLHRDCDWIIPQAVFRKIRAWRATYYERVYGGNEGAVASGSPDEQRRRQR